MEFVSCPGEEEERRNSILRGLSSPQCPDRQGRIPTPEDRRRVASSQRSSIFHQFTPRERILAGSDGRRTPGKKGVRDSRRAVRILMSPFWLLWRTTDVPATYGPSFRRTEMDGMPRLYGRHSRFWRIHKGTQ